MTDLHVYPSGKLCVLGKEYRCAFGENGFIDANQKQEGDKKSPVGIYPLRYILYRADRLEAPLCLDLPIAEISPQDGWCDAPESPYYNQPITRPFEASHEELFREDHIYDVIVVIGHNDDPIKKGKGSAVFFHIARESYQPTAGCIAVSQQDMYEILAECTETSRLIIHGSD